MGRIVITDPFGSTVDEHDHVGPFVEFLLDKYPNGFRANHVAAFNASKLSVEDYDRNVGQDDLVVLCIFPEGLTPLITAIVGAIISAALNWAINKLFSPKANKPSNPSYMNLPAAGSVYNLSMPSNVAKLGQVIPVAYGRNPLVPDLASQPYTVYWDNQQYICLLLCLGQGEFQLNDILLSDTSVNLLKSGVVQWWQFGPNDHHQIFGYVEAGTGAMESAWMGVMENVATSIEVTDIELTGGLASGGSSTGGAPNYFESTAQIWNGDWYGYHGGIFMLDNPSPYFFEMWQSGHPLSIIVSYAGDNDGTYPVATFASIGMLSQLKGVIGPAGATVGGIVQCPEWPNVSGTQTAFIKVVIDYSGTGNEAGTIPAGPFVSSSVGQETTLLGYDIVYPGGAYTLDPVDGRIAYYNMQIRFTAEPIDDNGNVIGSAFVYNYTEWLITTTPQRRTIWHPVGLGRYKVTATRLTAPTGNSSEASTVYWSGLKARLGNTTPSHGAVYGPVSLLAVRVKATEGISSDAATHVVVDCSRKLNGVATVSAMEAFKDIFLNTEYGARRPITELDTETINELIPVWDSENDAYFNAFFDQQTNCWEAMTLALQGKHAIPSTNGAVVTIVEDRAPVSAAMILTESNIREISKTYLFASPDDNDGVEVEYRGTKSNEALYVRWPETSDNPEQVQLWGCRGEDRALAYAKRRWAEVRYRRELYTIKVECEGHVIIEGQAIDVSHRLFGVETVRMIVTAIKPEDQFLVTLSAFKHKPEVFQT